MGKEPIKLISIEDFKQFQAYLDYYDEDLAVFAHWERCISDEPTQCCEPVRLDVFLIVVCQEGTLQIDINNQRHVLHKNDMLFCIPYSEVQQQMLLSNTFHGTLVALSASFMRRYLPWKKRTWEAMAYLYNNPVNPFLQEQARQFHPYFFLIRKQFEQRQNSYQKEIVHCLFATVLYEMASIIESDLNKSSVHMDDQILKQRDHIFARFMQALNEDDGTHRTVSYYAKQLCYTTKYISKVVKEVSGKTAMEFINQHAVEHIRYQLLYSDKSIKEIADQFEFSNLSFFGKYIRNHLGVSPSQFRKKIDKDKR